MPRSKVSSNKQYSTSSAARMLGISIDAVQRLVLSGKLPARKMLGQWRITHKALRQRLIFKQGRS